MSALIRLKRFWCLLLVIPTFIFTSLAAKFPQVTEKIYSTGIYPKLTAMFGRIFGALPFSLAEIIVITLPIALVVYIIKNVRKNTARLIATLLCVASLIYFGFTFLCGFNYHRLNFSTYCGFDVRPSSAEEVELLCKDLAARVNTYSAQIERNSDNVMISHYKNYYETAEVASKAYTPVGEKYKVLSGFCPRPKPVLASRAMSLADLVGVYFPFTFEANVNIDVPAYVVPAAMLHELAHFKGFMREDEANFISYLACSASGVPDFEYSGLMLALAHSTNALYSADKDAYWEVMNTLDEGIIADIRAHDAYWKQFEGPVTAVSEKVNDVYLKTNRQAAGVKSYGQMVDLLLAEFRENTYIAN